jgi:hypothetical protein
MPNVLTVERWCPNCKTVFPAKRIISRVGRETTVQETPCPTCGTKGETLLQT